jgi:hypothetical protein
MATLIMNPSRTPLESLESLDVGRVRSWQQANAINDNLMNQFKGMSHRPSHKEDRNRTKEDKNT